MGQLGVPVGLITQRSKVQILLPLYASVIENLRKGRKPRTSVRKFSMLKNSLNFWQPKIFDF